MKIIKNNTLLVESSEVKDAEKYLDELNEKPIDGELDLDSASEEEIISDIVAGGIKAGEENIDPEKVEKEAEFVEEVVEFIENPYGTAQPQFVKQVLQNSLRTALRDRRNGITKNFPNVILYGLAGFGKTAVVKEFCEEHGIYLFECDTKNLDAATVGGIPYATQDPKTGRYSQAPIPSEYWDSIDNNGKYQYTILFFDEINRTTGKIRGSLLDMINSHQVPTYEKDPKTGKTKIVKRFKNVLFSVIAINPADDIFPDNDPLDPAMVSRNGKVVKVGANKKEFLNIIDSIYEKILRLPLSQEDYKEYAGQKDLARALLSSSQFKFNTAQEVRDKFYLSQDQETEEMFNYLNYRTFAILLQQSDGTKDSLLWTVEYESGLGEEDINMYKSILSTYTDKVTVGNSIFGNGQQSSSVTRKSSIEAANILSDWIDSLE